MQSKTETNLPLNIEVGTEIVPTKEECMLALIGLFKALEMATGSTSVSMKVIQSITEGINSDPQFSKKVLTPENISKIYALKAKSEQGTVKIRDIESAFPELVALIPFWPILGGLLPKQFR